MDIKELLAEGTTKKVYATGNAEEVIIEFLDTLPAHLAKKKETVAGKAAINNAIASFLFEYLTSYNIPNHFVRKEDEKSLVAKRLEMLPITFHIWNVAGDELVERFGFEKFQVLEYPIIEMTLKNKKLNFPFINEYHAYALKISNRSEMDQMMRIATKVNAVLKSYFQRRRMILGDIRLEFGRAGNAIFLGDEISPDTFVVYELDEKGGVANPEKYLIEGSKKLEVYQAYHALFFNK